jgi:hypothetical protein
LSHDTDKFLDSCESAKIDDNICWRVAVTVHFHHEARIKFHRQLRELLETGCRAWQSAADDWTDREIAKGTNGSPLRMSAFLNGECSNAAYKFLKACEQGTKTPEASWLETERGFGQFITVLRQAGSARRMWFDREQLVAFERVFSGYWEIEKMWLEPHQDARAARKAFKALGGDDVLRGFLHNGEHQTLVQWYNVNIALSYRSNKYKTASIAARALVQGIIE